MSIENGIGTAIDVVGYGCGALYSCGAGQILGIPGTAISLLTALVQGVASGVFACMGNQITSNHLKDMAKISLICAGAFALGIIPVFGGVIAYALIKEGVLS